MARFLKLSISIIMILLLVLAVPVSAVEYPEYNAEKGYVNDFAGIISEKAEQEIIRMGKELQDKTTAQITAVTINSLEGEDIKTYANELFRKWGVGQKGKDNGVLILHSVGDREVWIEVGYGLNPILGTIRVTDYFDKDMAPYFKQGDYDTGFIKVYTDIATRIAEESGVSLDTNSGGTGAGGATRSEASDGTSGRASTRFNPAPILLVIFLVIDGVFFRFRITSMLIKIFFWSSIFRGGRGGGRGGFGGRGGGGFGGFGGGGGGGGGFGGFGGGSSGGGGGGGKY